MLCLASHIPALITLSVSLWRKTRIQVGQRPVWGRGRARSLTQFGPACVHHTKATSAPASRTHLKLEVSELDIFSFSIFPGQSCPCFGEIDTSNVLKRKQSENLIAPLRIHLPFFPSFTWAHTGPVPDYISQTLLHVDADMCPSLDWWDLSIWDICNFWVMSLKIKPTALDFLCSPSNYLRKGLAEAVTLDPKL